MLLYRVTHNFTDPHKQSTIFFRGVTGSLPYICRDIQEVIEVKADDASGSLLTVTCQLISGEGKLRKTIMIPSTIAYQSLICFFQSLLSSSSFHTLTTTECNFPTYSLTFSLQRAKRANPLFFCQKSTTAYCLRF